MAGRKQLSDEMKKYGYVFSIKRSVTSYGLIFGFMVIIGKYFGLQWEYILVLYAFMAMLLPFFLRNMLKNKYEQQRFSDVNIYMEQFLYSFQKSKIILQTLEDVESLFDEGKMKRTIRKTIRHIQNTYSESQVELEGLKMIEQEYPSEKLITMHRFALQVEKNGGKCQNAILLLLDARRIWADQVYQLLHDKKRYRVNITISILVSLLLCSTIYFISNKLQLSIMDYSVPQIMTTLVLIIDILIFYCADKKFSLGYLEEYTSNKKGMKKQYLKYMENHKKQKGYHLSQKLLKNTLTREIEKEFPKWLMQVSLLLQSENVPVSIYYSYEDAPEVLKPALKELIYGLEKAPNSIRPYLDFLKEFTLPEVKSSMKMLYSISEGTGGEADSQITDIIRRNQVLLNKSEEIKNQDSLAGMYGLFLAPQISGGMKLMTDLVLLLVIYMGKMGG